MKTIPSKYKKKPFKIKTNEIPYIEYTEKACLKLPPQEKPDVDFSEKMGILEDALKLSGATAFSRSVGLVRDAIIMNKLGSSSSSDVLNVGISFYTNAKNQLLEGNTGLIFLHLIMTNQINIGQTDHGKQVRSFYGYLILSAIAISMVFLLCSSTYFLAFFSGFKTAPDHFSDIVHASVLASFYGMFLIPIFYFTMFLNIYNNFLISNFLPSLTSLGVILSLYSLNIKPCYTLAVGHIIGLILQIIVLMPFTKSKTSYLKPFWKFNCPIGMELLELFSRILWVAVVYHMNFIMIKTCSALFTSGTLSCFATAERLVQTFSGIITNSLAQAATKDLYMFASASNYNSNDEINDNEIFTQNPKAENEDIILEKWYFALSTAFFFIIPTSVFLSIDTFSISSMLYFHGSCSWHDIKLIATLIGILAWTLIPHAIIRISSPMLIFAGDFSSAARIAFQGAMFQALTISLLHQEDIFCLAISSVVSHIVQAYVTIKCFKELFTIEKLKLNTLKTSVKKHFLATIPAVIISQPILWLGNWDLGPTAGNIIFLMTSFLVGFITYFSMSAYLKTEEATLFMKIFNFKFLKKDT